MVGYAIVLDSHTTPQPLCPPGEHAKLVGLTKKLNDLFKIVERRAKAELDRRERLPLPQLAGVA